MIFKKIFVEILFLLHCLLFLIVLFGWLSPRLWPVYVAALVLTLLSDLVFGYCLLSKWEFDLRKKIDPKTEYHYAWASYYTYWIMDGNISDAFFARASVVFLTVSLAAALYSGFF